MLICISYINLFLKQVLRMYREKAEIVTIAVVTILLDMWIF